MVGGLGLGAQCAIPPLSQSAFDSANDLGFVQVVALTWEFYEKPYYSTKQRACDFALYFLRYVHLRRRSHRQCTSAGEAQELDSAGSKAVCANADRADHGGALRTHQRDVSRRASRSGPQNIHDVRRVVSGQDRESG